MSLVRFQHTWLLAIFLFSFLVAPPAFGQVDAPPQTTSLSDYQLSEDYSALYFLLLGGPMLAVGRGSEGLKTRASGALVVGEFGSVSRTMGTGFTFEMRVCNWAWLPNRPETRVRLGVLTMGARFHIVTLFRNFVEMIRTAEPLGGGLYRLGKPEPVISSLEYVGVGAFARADVLSWTYVDNGKDDPRTPYDPFIEAGMFADLSSSLEWLGGLELSAGGAVSKSSGSMAFIRMDLKMLGHARRGKTPFNKMYYRKL